MKKKIYYLLFILFFVVIKVNAATTSTNIMNYNFDELCSAVKTNRLIQIGVDSYYKDSKILRSSSDSCIHASKYFGRTPKKSVIKIDDVTVKSSGKYGNYSYIYLKNQALSAGESIFFTIDLSSKKLKGNSYKDLRLVIKSSSSVNISDYNSMSYYVLTNKKMHGPYKLYEYKYLNQYTETNANKKIIHDVYSITSLNLVKDLTSSEIIKSIKVVPYEDYPLHAGMFRMFNLSLIGYSSKLTNSSTIKISDAEDITRHNIVNNMVRNLTVKWDISPNSKRKLIAYYSDGRAKITLDPKSSKVYYGLPYSTAHVLKATLYSFLDKTEKNVSKNGAIYSYKIADKYLYSTTSTNGNNYKAGDSIKKDLHIFMEGGTPSELKEKAIKEYNKRKNKNMPIYFSKSDLDKNDFITNKGGYLLGHSCSSSAMSALGTELSVSEYIDSYGYFYSSDVYMLGGLSLKYSEVSNKLRKEGILKSSTHMTQSLFNTNYTKVIKSKYKEQKIYNAYALTLPGDIISHAGHVRVITGYPIIVCNDGKHKFGGNNNTSKYTSNSCQNYGGIDPNKSYVITSEGGTAYTARNNTNHINTSSSAWKITLDKKYTDLTDVDQIYNNPNVKSTARPNLKYSFSELYNEKKMYIAFRYKKLRDIGKNETIEKPIIKLELDKDYSNTNQTMYEYMTKNKKLKGRIVSNYMIDAIRIEVNGTKYYIYPNQTKDFSLYKGITNTKIINAIKKLDYSKKNTVKVSVKAGPNISNLRNASNADSSGYITILNTSNAIVKKTIKSKSVSLNKTSLNLFSGQSNTLSATISPSNTTSKAVTWTSSNEKVLTVDSNGKVKAIGNGTATVTVKAKDSGVSATCTVEVKTRLTGIKFSKTKTTINKNKTEKISVTFQPSTASNKKLKWKSSNTRIATVDSTGKVTAISSGTTTIKAISEDGLKEASITVSVVVPTVKVKSVNISKVSTSINVGSTEKISYTITPTNATNKTVSFKSSDIKVATVSTTGTITAKEPGTCNITITTADQNKTSTIKVTVLPIRVNSISVDKKTIILEIGEEDKITSTISPSNATNKKVIWSSSNSNIVKVDQIGNIEALSSGEVIITALTSDGNKKATTKVIVNKYEETKVPKQDEEEEETIVPDTKPTPQTTKKTITHSTKPSSSNKDDSNNSKPNVPGTTKNTPSTTKGQNTPSTTKEQNTPSNSEEINKEVDENTSVFNQMLNFVKEYQIIFEIGGVIGALLIFMKVSN